MTHSTEVESGLDAVIDQQLAVLHELNTTLLAEHAAIAARDIEALNARGQDKLAALTRLSTLETRRREFAGESDSAGGHRFDEIRQLTEQCRRQNGTNDALLRAERRFVDGLLSILRSGTLAGNTYDAGAGLSQAPSRRLPLASA